MLGAPVSDAQNPTRTVARFTKGDIRFTQGGKAYSARLVNGRIDVTEELAGEAPLEVRTLSLTFALLGSRSSGGQPDVMLVLTNVEGPGSYEGSSLLAFSVRTSGGRTSTFQHGKSLCTVLLTRVGRGGVDGTATCAGEMAGADGKPGAAVTDVSFDVAP